MKVLVIGGVAAGTKAAAKLKRLNPDSQVTILTKSRDISYAGCGLPYYVGGLIADRQALIVNTPERFEQLTGARVLTGMEAVKLCRESKTVQAVDIKTGEEQNFSYDKLVIAVGASPIAPPIPGIDLENVFFMRTPEDAQRLRTALESGEIQRVVVGGGGFIGLEIMENLLEKGLKVTVVDMAEQILPGFDPEMAAYVEDKLADQGVLTLTGAKIEAILGEGKVAKVQTSKRTMKADAVVLSMGIRANTAFLADSGLEILPNRTLAVDARMRTNDPDIYAVGDCVSVTNGITGERAWAPMGSSANLEGRLAACNINGEEKDFSGVLGTGVAKLPGINVGKTGLSESAARRAGYDVESVVTVLEDKAHYYPDSSQFIIKMIADRAGRKLLGLQALGRGAVDKLVDIAATAISLGAGLEQLENLDLSYAPPFSTAIHPFVHTVNVLLNKLDGRLDSLTPAAFSAGDGRAYQLIDASIVPSIPGAPYIALEKVEGPLQEYPPDAPLLLVCTKGKRAYMLQQKLKHYGYKNTLALEGGSYFNHIQESEDD
jgi:NADPH-dependent 2,4-dienoyl-CoA reductase/sulfur reductase-like enzyme/rhodanese-related sulfurtransferase